MPTLNKYFPLRIASSILQLPSQNKLATQQIKVLKNLLFDAKDTEFGKRFDFSDLLRLQDPRKEFRSWIPAYTYESLNNAWWSSSRNDKENVTWPGLVPYYGVSSGSTQAASKFIPVTQESLDHWNRISQRIITQLFMNYKIPLHLFSKDSLMVGGSSMLMKEGKHFWGDNSGIIAKNRPGWLKSIYKPEKNIQDKAEWSERLEAIIENAPNYNIAFMVGNIAWIEKIVESIVHRYHLNTIHDMWPHLTVILNSGVFMEPYLPSIKKYFAKEVMTMDIYSATEGIFAYQNQPNTNSMKLITNENVFYEFIPYSDKNFTDGGNLKQEFPEIVPIEHVEENRPYALMISTTSGAWHYQIGDVIKFTDAKRGRIKLLGRTKDQISIAGEHLTIGNISQCVQFINSAFDISIKEYCVAGIKNDQEVIHHWYVGVNEKIDVQRVKLSIDDFLKMTNDDYKVMRKELIKDLVITPLPENYFFEFLAYKHKLNGQSKTPRIVKDDLLGEWLGFLKSKNIN